MPNKHDGQRQTRVTVGGYVHVTKATVSTWHRGQKALNRKYGPRGPLSTSSGAPERYGWEKVFNVSVLGEINTFKRTHFTPWKTDRRHLLIQEPSNCMGNTESTFVKMAKQNQRK